MSFPIRLVSKLLVVPIFVFGGLARSKREPNRLFGGRGIFIICWPQATKRIMPSFSLKPSSLPGEAPSPRT